VVRLLLAEAGTLSVIGGAIGVALAYGGVAAFLRLAPPSIPRLDSVAVDGRVLCAATLMTLATAVGAGLLPALRLTARRPWEALQRGGRTASDTSTGARTVLVGGQLALAVVLLSAAGLLFTSFMRVRSMDPGFEAEGLVVVGTATRGPQRFEGGQAALLGQAWERVEDAVSDVPGVASVAMVNTLPFQAPSWAPRLLLPGDDPEVVREGIAGYVVTAGYPETMGTRVIEGRDLEPSDGPDAEPVILVNEEFVRTQLEGGEALGALVTRTREGPAAGGERVAMRIVGVVEDVVQARVEDGPRPAVYLPYGQAEPSQLGSFWTVVRTAATPENLAPALRSALDSVDRWPRTVATMQSRLSDSRASPRFQTFLIGAFALIAMLFAAAGLHGSLAHLVRSRQREIGVRMALGADRSSVPRMVLGQGMLVTGVGLALGLSGTLALSRVLASFLYDVRPYDPPTLLVVALVLTLVAAAACLSPARRATTVDPVRVLGAE
jgi:predicted permease